MTKRIILAALLLQAAPLQPSATAQTAAHEATDVYVRRLAGLPAASARGEIEILDIGHHPLDTMVSIVARRSARGWTVSYACAASPYCAPGRESLTRGYKLSASDGAEVDRLVAAIKTGQNPGGETPNDHFIGGSETFVINEGSRSWRFARIAPGDTLGRLRQLLRPPADR